MTIQLEFNREAILHMLKYIRGVYSIPHKEQDDEYEAFVCPYCIVFLQTLSKGLEDIELLENIQRLRIKAKSKMNMQRQGV